MEPHSNSRDTIVGTDTLSHRAALHSHTRHAVRMILPSTKTMENVIVLHRQHSPTQTTLTRCSRGPQAGGARVCPPVAPGTAGTPAPQTASRRATALASNTPFASSTHHYTMPLCSSSLPSSTAQSSLSFSLSLCGGAHGLLVQGGQLRL